MLTESKMENSYSRHHVLLGRWDVSRAGTLLHSFLIPLDLFTYPVYVAFGLGDENAGRCEE